MKGLRRALSSAEVSAVGSKQADTPINANWAMPRSMWSVTLPQPFQRLRKSLCDDPLVHMHRVAGEHELIMIPLVREHFRKPFVRLRPVVHAVGKRSQGIEQI